jgi:hypothetical protein
MGNIKNFNFNKLDLILSNSDYWDFFLATGDNTGGANIPTTGDCLVSLFDFNDSNIYVSGNTSSQTISSLVSWTGATNSGYTFSTIGLTGIDNGLVTFVKESGDTSNNALLSALTGTTLIIPSGDSRLHLNRISGSTGDYIYPIDILNDVSGDYAQFCGGFYQGYYKIDGSTYQVLPTRVHKGWVAAFWLKKDETLCSGYTATTLNDTYPDNKGIFFYMGTRAENKFWNRFEGADTGCTSGCTVESGCTDTLSPWCTVPKETDIFIGSSGNTFPLSPYQVNQTEITNQFLIYGRASVYSTICSTCGGNVSGFGQKNVCDYDGSPIIITTPKTVLSNTQNPFLIYGRASSGSTRCGSCGGYYSGLGNQNVCTFSGTERSIEYDNLDYNVDILDNALAFRIKDDGSIGYRALVITGQCSGTTYISGATILEEYSASGTVSGNVWTNVMIRFTTDYYDDCDLEIKPKRTGKLMFYVNGKLKFVVNNFSEFIARRLNDHMEKQVGVPFNISLGGGSQGLIETQTFDGRDPEDANLPIEENFGGSFIGGISQFKLYICDLYFDTIQNIYNEEKLRYYPKNTYLADENGDALLQENGSYIIVD